MELDKLSKGEKISAISAVLLFIFMFFDWFGAKVSGAEGFTGEVPNGNGNAWDYLDIIPIFLLAAIVVALAVAVIRLTDADIEPPFSLNTLVAILGGFAVLLILYRIVNPPGGGDLGAGVEIDTTLKIWIFVSLICAAGIAYGGYSAMREEGTTFGDAADRLSGRGGGSAAPGGGGGGEHLPPAPPPPPPPAPQGGLPGYPEQPAPPAPPAPEQPVQPPPPPPPPQAPQEYAPPPPQQQPPPPPAPPQQQPPPPPAPPAPPPPQ